MYSHMKTSLIRFLLWVAVLLWMAVIFCLSAQEATQSSALSGSTIRKVVEITQPGFRELQVEQKDSIVADFQHIARKTAHVLAYQVLGVLSISALLQYPSGNGVRFAAALAVCIGYAGTDEVHQLFVPGRSGQIGDVCIDAGGALVGIGIVLVIHWIWRRRRRKHRIDESVQ